MIGIVLATHGKLANGFMDAIKMILGEPEALEIASLTTNGGIDKFTKDLKAAVEKVSSKDGVFILTDLQSGTPYNTSVILSQTNNYDFDIKITSGINLPTLLEILFQRNNYSLDELSKILLDIGSTSIALYENTNNSSDEDDEL